MSDSINADSGQQPVDTAAVMAAELAKDGEQPPMPAKPQQSITLRDTEKSILMDPNLYLQMKALAQDFINSGAIPKCWESAAQVLVGLQTGLEMGMKPMEAMNSLYPVNGAINVWGKATTRRLVEHGYAIKYSNESDKSCTATVTKGKEKYTETFTFEEAEQSGYTKDKSGFIKIGWKPGMNRRKKLRYGVLAFIISTYIPQVLGAAAGIVEVSEDFDLSDGDATTSTTDKAEERRARIRAAADKRKELTDGKFTPKGMGVADSVPVAVPAVPAASGQEASPTLDL